MKTPVGYMSVQHADGIVHAINLSELGDDLALHRNRVVCDASTGVSSDDGARDALKRRDLTCSHCIGILS